MGMRRSRTKQLTDSILGQHIALSVAAGLARTQLVADPLTVYDAQHLSEMIDVIARALAKVAPLYVRDAPHETNLRQLTPEEQESAAIRRGATLLVLKSGQTYSSVTVRRGDLREAIAVLKAVGVPELSVPRARESDVARPSAQDVNAALVMQLDEIEALLKPPLVQTQVERANRIALAIARRGPQGRVSNIAMQLMSCLHEARDTDVLPQLCWALIARLRQALDEVQAKN
jgi:hypothetical protein